MKNHLVKLSDTVWVVPEMVVSVSVTDHAAVKIRIRGEAPILIVSSSFQDARRTAVEVVSKLNELNQSTKKEGTE
jgi:hypothetical protein